MALTLARKFGDELKAQLLSLGFQKQKGSTYTVELGQGVFGWLGVNIAKRGGPPFSVLLNAGLGHIKAQMIVSEVRGSMFSKKELWPICFSSVSQFLGEAPSSLAWLVDENSAEKVAKDIGHLCSERLIPVFRKHASVQGLLALISKGFGEATGNAFYAPVLHAFAGNPSRGLDLIDSVELARVAPDFAQSREILKEKIRSVIA